MKVMLKFLIVGFLLFAVSGCIEYDLPDIPDVGVSVDQLNKDLRLIAFSNFNSFKIGESLHLELRVESDREIQVSPDFDSHIFALNAKTKEWQEVQEVPDLGIFESQTFVLSREEGEIREISIDLDPVLSNRSEPVNLLIVVTGNIVEGGKTSDHKVGAYIVIILKP